MTRPNHSISGPTFWFRKLSKRDKETVRIWLCNHRPPADWTQGFLQYAFDKMPRTLISVPEQPRNVVELFKAA